MRRHALAVAALLALASASSQAWVLASTDSGMHIAAKAAQATAAEAITKASGSSATIIRGAVNLVGPGNVAVAGRLSLSLTTVEVAAVAGRALAYASGVGGIVMTGMVAYELYDRYRMRAIDGKIKMDEGQNDAPFNKWRCQSGSNWNTWIYNDSQSACQAFLIQVHPQVVGNPYSCNDANGVPGNGLVSATYTLQRVGVSNTFTYTQNISRTRVCPGFPGSEVTPNIPFADAVTHVEQMCPSYPNPDFPGLNVVEGSAKGPDGKCATGNYSKDMTPEGAGDFMATHPTANDVDYEGMMREAAGLPPESKAGTIPNTAQGTGKLDQIVPAKIPGPTITTSYGCDINGFCTDVETTDYDYVQSPNVPGAGDFTKTTTTTTTMTKDGVTTTLPPKVVSSATPASGAAAGDASDPCVVDPGRLGCVGLGKVDDDVPLGKKDINVAVTPMAGWGADDAACPAPSSFVLIGQTIEIAQDGICQFSRGIRWVVIGMSAILAAGIVLGGLKS